MPPNFGIKVILFQNYHVYIPDWSTVMGREPWSGVYCLSPLASTPEPMPQNLSLLHGHLDSSLRAGYQIPIWPWREQLNNSAMSLFYLPPWVLPTPMDPPWSILLLWRSWAVRRILVHRVIASLILAPRWARRLAIAIRRILVTSPESSFHVHRLF